MRAGVLIAVVALCGLACQPDPTDQGSMNSTEIAISDDDFTPAVDTVAVNQNIRWVFGSTNADTHNVTWDSGPFTPTNSGDKINGSTYTVYFGTVGTYAYHCSHHGTAAGSGMAGTLTVQ